MEIGLNFLDTPSPLHTNRCSFIQPAISLCPSRSFSSISFFPFVSVASSIIFHFPERVGKVLFWRSVCFSFLLSFSLAHFFPFLVFPSPSSFFPPSLSLISSRCVSCIPLVRAEGEGSLKRRQRGEEHGGRGVRVSGRERCIKRDQHLMKRRCRESPLSSVCMHVCTHLSEWMCIC